MKEFDKAYLISSIKEYDKFSKSQKALLILLVEFEDNNIANISIDSLAKMSQFSKTIIYKSLTKLEQLKFIVREKIPNEKIGYIRLIPEAFPPVIEFYKKKKEFLPKKVY